MELTLNPALQGEKEGPSGPAAPGVATEPGRWGGQALGGAGGPSPGPD